MSQKKILVISSNPALLKSLQRSLSEEGYRVLCAADDSGEMDSMLQLETPDLVIVDIMLTGVDGIRVSLNIRRKYDVPIIMLTSRLSDVNKVKDLELSAEETLSSSINAFQLTEWINGTFDRDAVMRYSDQHSHGNGNGKKKLENL